MKTQAEMLDEATEMVRGCSGPEAAQALVAIVNAQTAARRASSVDRIAEALVRVVRAFEIKRFI